MRFGYRKPSPKKILRAHTTGKYIRKAKSTINPYYGKKGIGWVKSPHRAISNKIYHKTTRSVFKDVGSSQPEPVKYKSTRKSRRGANKKENFNDAGTGLAAFLACIWFVSGSWGFNWILLIPLTIIVVFLIIAVRKNP